MRKTIVAKYPGMCSRCGKPIKPGETVTYERRGRIVHPDCQQEAISQEDYPCSDMGYEDQCAARCGL